VAVNALEQIRAEVHVVEGSDWVWRLRRLNCQFLYHSGKYLQTILQNLVLLTSIVEYLKYKQLRLPVIVSERIRPAFS
jgi:hypothetical protein